MKPRRKLCIVLPFHWSAAMGGAEYQVRCLLDRLVGSEEFEIYYVTQNANPEYRPRGYQILKLKRWLRLSRYGFFFDTAELLGVLGRIRPDIIYQRVGCAYTGISAFYALRQGCRMVWHIASDNDLLPLGKNGFIRSTPHRIEKAFLNYGVQHAQEVVAQTYRQAALLKDFHGRSASAVIRNFHPFPSEAIDKRHPVRIAWVANFNPWKQPECFVRLVEDLARTKTGFESVMIGARAHWAPAWQDQLEMRIGKTPHLAYLGRLPVEQVNRLLATSHIFVSTSMGEGFPNTFIQAWMRRVPVVSLHVDPDGVFERHGFGFHSRTYERMLEDVKYLVKDSGTRDEMGRNAQEYAFQQHSERNIDALLGMLRAPGHV